MDETGMKEQNELVRLSIRNADVTVKAYSQLCEVDEKLLKELDVVAESTLENLFPDWDRICTWHEIGGELSFWPKGWRVAPDDDNAGAWFTIGSSEDEPFLWLNAFTGTTGGQVHFEFDADRKTLHGLTPQLWRTKKAAFFAAHEADLRKAGFCCEDGCIHRPFKLEVETLAEAWPDLGDEVFEPVRKALEDIRSVVPLFESFVGELQQNRQA